MSGRTGWENVPPSVECFVGAKRLDDGGYANICAKCDACLPVLGKSPDAGNRPWYVFTAIAAISTIAGIWLLCRVGIQARVAGWYVPRSIEMALNVAPAVLTIIHACAAFFARRRVVQVVQRRFRSIVIGTICFRSVLVCLMLSVPF